MHIIVTTDTEADDQWKKDGSPTIENVFALGRFQELCERFSMPPTYLITYEVAADARAAALLRNWQDAGMAEIGAHLHPWTTPPLEAGEGATRAFPSELSDDALRAKLTTLTDTIERACGKRPASYRAGRWGFDARQAALLKELGYIFDSSVTPGISWRKTIGIPGGAGGPDFRGEPAAPRMLNDAVLEAPMTILRAGLLRRLRWLRIFENTTTAHLRAVLRAARRLDLPVVVFMIHSSELMVGKSPYVKTPEALDHVYTMIEVLFELCAQEGIAGITASDFAHRFSLLVSSRGR